MAKSKLTLKAKVKANTKTNATLPMHYALYQASSTFISNNQKYCNNL